MPFHSYSYGSMTLPYSRLSVSTSIIYADDGITQSATQYNFSIQGVIAKSTQADFQLLMTQMRCQLQTPRQPLIISQSSDGVTFIPLYSYNTSNDIDFGPKPTNLSIDQFTGGLAGTYSFQVTVTAKDCFNNCNLSGTPPVNILSLSRNFSFTVNETGLTTMVTSGVLTVGRNTAFQNSLPADEWRNYVTPLLPKNFRRTNESYVQSSNGLQLQYSITDQEMLWTFPLPVTSGRSNFSVRSDTTGGRVYYSLTGEFGTTKNHTKTELYNAIIALAMAKFPNGAVSPGPNAFMWTSRTITEDVYENSLAFNFSGYAVGYIGDATNINDNLWTHGIGGTPPGSDGLNNAIGAYGSDVNDIGSGVVGQAPIIYDACGNALQKFGTNATKNPVNNSVPSYGDNDPTPKQTPTPGTIEVFNLSVAHQKAPFVSISEKISFEINNYIRRFPSKVINKPPLIQQTANPTLTIIQAGYIIRDDPSGMNPPEPPLPFYGSVGQSDSESQSNALHGYIDNSSICTCTGEPLPVAPQMRWSMNYRWTIIVQDFIANTGSMGIAFPQDPRIKDSPSVLVPSLPNQLVINPGA